MRGYLFEVVFIHSFFLSFWLRCIHDPCDEIFSSLVSVNNSPHTVVVT